MCVFCAWLWRSWGLWHYHVFICSCSWESSLDYYHLIDSPPLERRLSHPDYKAAYWEYWEQHWDLAEKWCPAEWLGRDLLQFMIGICSGHCRRRHWAASTFNCKLLVLASSSFVLGTLGGPLNPGWNKMVLFSLIIDSSDKTRYLDLNRLTDSKQQAKWSNMQH